MFDREENNEQGNTQYNSRNRLTLYLPFSYLIWEGGLFTFIVVH
jgi:hypothetical protein